MTDEIEFWKCPNKHCGFLVTAIEMKSLRFEPTCRCGVKFGDFTSILKKEPIK